jgi:hypothetical protein
VPLPIVLALGAFVPGVLALIFLFSLRLLEVPTRNPESHEATRVKASIKRRKRYAALLGAGSALFATAFVLNWLG